MKTDNIGPQFFLVTDKPAVAAKVSRATWIGLFLSLFGTVILTGFYLWRRDLVANMIGHGLVDFVANILPRLFP
jgi:uncharacterized membrane protein